MRGDWLVCALLYNLFAFAVQLPLGIVCDTLRRPGLFAAAGCVLVAVSPALSSVPRALCIAAGLGNAAFHVGGGVSVMRESPGRAGPLGVFVSPGAFGIYFGTVWGKAALFPLWAAAPVMAVCAALCALCRQTPPSGKDATEQSTLTGRAAALALIVAVVALRSFGGMAMRFPWKTGLWAFWAVAATVLGKAAGGFLSDRFGMRAAAAASLLPCAVLLLFSGLPLPGCIAVLLFNVTMPITLHRAHRLLPGRAGLAFGLTTFALFLGFAAVYLGAALPEGAWAMAAVAGASLVLALPALPGGRE